MLCPHLYIKHVPTELRGSPNLSGPTKLDKKAWRLNLQDRTVQRVGNAVRVPAGRNKYLCVGSTASWRIEVSRAKEKQTQRVEPG